MGVRPDGETIKSIREAKAFTQEKLSLLSSVNVRTIQRAENGDRIAADTLAFIAEALQVPFSRVVASDDEDDVLDQGQVVLRAADSGKAIADGLSSADVDSITCDLEPDDSNVELVAELMDQLDAFRSDVACRERPGTRHRTVADRLRKIAALNATKRKLAETGVQIFYGEYFSSGYKLSWNSDEDFWYHRGNAVSQPLRTVLVRISDSREPRLYQKVADQWVERQTAEDDEVSF